MTSLLTFKAGKMKFDDTSKSLTPLTDKGQTGAVEDDMIVFEGDAVFKPVKQAGPDARVFMLHFPNSGRRQFYWMQDINKSKDAEIVQQVNKLLNNPPTDGDGDVSMKSADSQTELEAAAAKARAEASEKIAAAEKEKKEKEEGEKNSSSTNSQPASSSSSPATDAPNVAAGGLSVELLQQMLGQSAPDKLGIEALGEILSADHLKETLASDEMKPLLSELVALLPAEQDAPADPVDRVVDALRSPQVKQAMKLLDSALNSGNTELVIASMGLPKPPRPGASGVETLLKALILKSQQQP